MDWRLAVEIVGFIGGIATFIALMLAPMFYLGSKIDSCSREIQELRKEFYIENKNFHSRLVTVEKGNVQ